jgi:hypothetical protein
MTARIRKLVSGGQTGVDRAALDFAIAHNIPYGGWVPKGGRAEDMKFAPGLLHWYPELREHASRDWAPRTEQNVINSGATLIVLDANFAVGPGTKLTIRLAAQHHKPSLKLDVIDEHAYKKMFNFLTQFNTDIALNVAGSRESSIPGIYDRTKRLLETFVDRDIYAP